MAISGPKNTSAHMLLKTALTVSGLAWITACANTALGAAFANGGFDSSLVQADYSSGATISGSWIVGDPKKDGIAGLGTNSDEVYWRNNSGNAQAGAGSITFFGGNRGTQELYQTFDTQIGQSYDVSFYVRVGTGITTGVDLYTRVFDGALPDVGGGYRSSIDYGTGGWTGGSLLGSTTITSFNAAYTLQTFSFSATSTSSTLSFLVNETVSPSSLGEVWFDTVSVTPVPEPSSLALVGLAGIGLLVRRRR